MLTNIISKFQTYWDNARLKKQADELRGSLPILLANKLIDGYWAKNQDVIKDFSEDFVRNTSTKMMEEILLVLGSDNPTLANREKLSENIIECARYQVLVLTPEPNVDETGLRGRLGISGELKERILDLIKVDKYLKEVFHSQPDDITFNQAWDLILFRYRYSWSFMNVFSGMRTYLKDANDESSKDWMRPYFASMCAYQEGIYRHELGMPNLLEDTPDSRFTINALAYSTFFNFVMRGDRYPDLSWDEKYPDLESPRLV